MLTQPSYRSLRNPAVAIVGATGAVGVELVKCLEARGFPASSLRLLASARSAGRQILYRGEAVSVDVLNADSFVGVDLVFFAADADTSKIYAPLAVTAGAVVIDNSSAFRMDLDCPLVTPEVNLETLVGHRGIIANPNCVAILACVAIAPLQRRFGLRRLQIATYQAASGAGQPAMEELAASTRAHLAGEAYPPQVLRHPYAFNLFSHNTAIDPETGYNDEETKVIRELRKIFGEPDLRASATCVRVPVLRAHSIALNVT
ncbi:MAG: aspartate-semialdehyde dehydrogenase, partial [Alphaproteobacteria bacterium]